MKKNDKELSGWIRILISLAAMAVITVILLLLSFNWMKNYTRHGEYISVPDVEGMVEDEASILFEVNGLRYEISDSRYDANLQEGQIIEQRPSAGSNVKAGRIIYLTVNSGKIPTKKLPDVVDNSSLRAAESKLLGAGFTLTEPELIPGDLDWVYEIRYNGRTVESGEEIPEGALLTIVAGNGDEAPEESGDSLDANIIDEEFFY